MVLRAQSPGAPQLIIEDPTQGRLRQTLHVRGLPPNTMCDFFIGGVRLGFDAHHSQFHGRFSYGFETAMFPTPLPREVSLTCDGVTLTGTQVTEAGIVALSPAGFVTFDEPVNPWAGVVRGNGLPPSCGFFSVTAMTGTLPTDVGSGITDTSGNFNFMMTVPPAAQNADSFQWVPPPSCSAPMLQGANPGGPYPRVVSLSPVTPVPAPQLVIEAPETRTNQLVSGDGLPPSTSCDLTLGGADAGPAMSQPNGTFFSQFETTGAPGAFPRSVLLTCGAQAFTGTQAGTTGIVPLSPSGSLNFQQVFVNTGAAIRGRLLPPDCASFTVNHATGSASSLMLSGMTNQVGEFSYVANFPAAAQNAERYQWVGQGACANNNAYQGTNPGGPYPRVISLVPFRPSPTINWFSPSALMSGTALSALQLNATAAVPGTFAYTPTAGTVLPPGNGHVLSVTFTPADLTRFDVATRTVTVNVLPASSGARFSGRVTDAATGLGLANVTVVAFTGPGVPVPVAAAISDASGQYVMPPLAPGAYAAQATGAAGFVDEMYNEVSCAVGCNLAAGTRFSLTAGQLRANINFTLGVAGATSSLMWTQKAPANNPSSRWGHAMAYDRARGQLVMFGGRSSGVGAFGDTWVWDGASWIQKFPLNSPTPRMFAAMVYDAARGEIVLFGGTSEIEWFGDTWTWDGSNWTERASANRPPALAEHAMTYDAARSEVVLFGGTVGVGRPDETWVWDGVDWSLRNPQTRPPARVNHAMAYDEARDEVVLFGGHINGAVNDMWTWDGNDWTARSPANRPLPTSHHAMAYDAERGEVILFGGGEFGPAGARNETWAWNGGDWTRRIPARSPTPRNSLGLAYDPDRRQLVLFGGCCEPQGTVFGDTWVWDDFSAVKVTPVIAWPTPSPIAPGTPLSSAQLNATANVPGSFAYAPPLGTILAAGNGQILSVTFTPTDSAAYNVGTSTVTIDVRAVATPPTIDPMPDLIVEATAPDGATVNYTPPASHDATDGDGVASCNPAPGSRLPLGHHPVSCDATNSGGVTTTVSPAFDVWVRDSVAPAVLITSPGIDAVPTGTSLDVLAQVTDVVGVSGVTINGVAATLTTGTSQLGTWQARVPITLPVVAGGALPFNAQATDAAGNTAVASRRVDADGIPHAMDRSRTTGADQSDRHSAEFNTGTTVGAVTRGGWTTMFAAAPTFTVGSQSMTGGISLTIAGAGTRAVLSPCTGSAKNLWLEVSTESAYVACDPATGTMGVQVIKAVPQLEFWKEVSPTVWQLFNLPTGAKMSAGSPATADPANPSPIEAQFVMIDDAGTETIVGGYQLGPGATVDVSIAPGATDEIIFAVLAGTVTVTVGDRTTTVREGQQVTVPLTTPGKLTGEGRVDVDEVRYQFAFEVAERASGAERGRLHLKVERPRKKQPQGGAGEFRSTALEHVVFSDDPTARPQRNGKTRIDTATFSGAGRWNGTAGYTFTATATDRGEPGHGRDHISVTVRDPQGAIVATFSDVLDAGNIQSLDHHGGGQHRR